MLTFGEHSATQDASLGSEKSFCNPGMLDLDLAVWLQSHILKHCAHFDVCRTTLHTLGIIRAGPGSCPEELTIYWTQTRQQRRNVCVAFWCHGNLAMMRWMRAGGPWAQAASGQVGRKDLSEGRSKAGRTGSRDGHAGESHETGQRVEVVGWWWNKNILRMFQRQREELQLNSEEKTLIGTKMIQTGLKDSFGRGGQGKLKPGKTECWSFLTKQACVCVYQHAGASCLHLF